MPKVSHWRCCAAQTIERVVATTAPGTDLKAAIDAAYPFGERKYTPYKIWLEERKKVLIRLNLYKVPGSRKCKYHPDGQTCLICGVTQNETANLDGQI